MAKLKKAKARNVDHKQGVGNTEKEVDVTVKVADAEPTPPPAIAEEETFKVMEKGQAIYYTESQYRKKYGKKKGK